MKDFDLETATPEELRQAVRGLSVELEKALEEIVQLKRQIQELEKKKGKSATPFSKGEREAKPKRPGRKAGQGQFTRRAAPSQEELTDTIDVSLKDEDCPCCGAELNVQVELATTTDIPEVIKPIIRGFYQEVGTCLGCGHRVRARHPQLGEDQYGASAHRLGPGVMAQALTLHYHHGLPLRKVPGVIQEAFGIELTQSALTQAAIKLAGEDGEVGHEYARLRGLIEQAEVVNTDDTGWKVGGEKAQLMNFSTPQVAVYQIRDHHRSNEVREVLTEKFDGVMITDRFTSYDAQCFDDTKQQKCLAHIQRNLSDLEQSKTGRAKSFSRQLKATLSECLQLWHRHRDGHIQRSTYLKKGRELCQRVDHQLRERPLSDDDNARMRRELSWHHEWGNLVRFLADPAIEPTNNRAERMLRPAVIARKVSQCSKNGRGAQAYSAFKSVLTSIALQTTGSVSTALRRLITGGGTGAHSPPS